MSTSGSCAGGEEAIAREGRERGGRRGNEKVEGCEKIAKRVSLEAKSRRSSFRVLVKGIRSVRRVKERVRILIGE